MVSGLVTEVEQRERSDRVAGASLRSTPSHGNSQDGALTAMQELGYLNGHFRPAAEIHVSVNDWGFVQGVTLAEQLRTFAGQPFAVQEHLNRLINGVTLLGWNGSLLELDLDQIVRRVAGHNYAEGDPLDDLGVCIFITPGAYPGYGAQSSDPVVCVHSYRLPFHLWHSKYRDGLTLVTVATRQVPSDCWPPELKCRSRMHYYRAAQEARRQMPEAIPLLLDHQGRVCETPTANVVAYFESEGIVSPSREKILPGVSLGYLHELAGELGVRFEFRDLTPAELEAADELMLTSTPYCVLPVAQFNRRRWKVPGRLYEQLLHAWSQATGVNIEAQANRFAQRP
jgi:branched-subunit amino acid aminotransferase/4-amino-4-deoxychorismate lyase